MSDCSFCHGAPVYNAGRWINPSEREIAECPRCGDRHCRECGTLLTEQEGGMCSRCYALLTEAES
jgi:hypothetical protein